MLEICVYPNPILKVKCEPIIDFGPHLSQLVNHMSITMTNGRGIGLAANQVGITKRIFVMNVGDSIKEYINPEIIEGKGESKFKEGCLSFPGVFAFVKRYETIKIKAKDMMGNDFEEELTGIEAICFQHELDHLDGITFYDHLSSLQKNLLQKKMAQMKKKIQKKNS